ncbi:MAG: histidine phosphatase family protein [Deltaproteobacteria bacterium]|nr:histidine phosphatase family protein [Deltaproteobacteria bacterium]
MFINIFLVRSGETTWRAQGRLLGRRDMGLSPAGHTQAQAAAAALAGLEVSEVLSSPLSRAVQTAEYFSEQHRIQIARDQRLTDLDVGSWEGRFLRDAWENDEFRQSLTDERTTPAVERLEAVRARVVASVEQAVADNPVATNLILVSHAAPLRILLAHYLGMPLGHFHRLRVSPGAVSVLRFESDLQRMRVLAVNWAAPVTEIIAPRRAV